MESEYKLTYPNRLSRPATSAVVPEEKQSIEPLGRARKQVRYEALLAAFALASCGAKSNEVAKTLKVDLKAWGDSSGESLNIADANLLDAWFSGNVSEGDQIERLELVLDTSTKELVKLDAIPSSVEEIVINADGKSVGSKTFKLEFQSIGNEAQIPTIFLTSSVQADDESEYALEVIGLNSVIISHADSLSLSSISGPTLSDIFVVGEGDLEILSTGQATDTGELVKFAFNSDENNGAVKVTVTSRPEELDILGTQYSDVVTLLGNFEQGEYSGAVAQYANSTNATHKFSGLIDFSEGEQDTLVVFGAVDLRDVAFRGLEKIEVNSVLVMNASDILQMESVEFLSAGINPVSGLIVVKDVPDMTEVDMAQQVAAKLSVEAGKTLVLGTDSVDILNVLDLSSALSANPAVAVETLEVATDTDGNLNLARFTEQVASFTASDIIDVDGANTSSDDAVDTTTSSTTPIDTTAPSAFAIDATLEVDNIVSSAEDETVSVTGTSTGVEEGQSVYVRLSDGTTDVEVTATVGSDGTWTATDANISELTNGEITITADVSDAAGNAATQATKTITLDNEGYAIALDGKTLVITGDIEADVAVLNGSDDVTENFTISGSNGTYTAVAKDGVFNGSESLSLTAVLTYPTGDVDSGYDAVTGTIDTTVPDAPTLMLDGKTLTITGEADADVKILDGSEDVTEKFEFAVTNEIQESIDLSSENGFSGQLINPVQVTIDGSDKTFYYWDFGDSGDSAGGTHDLVSHQQLDNLFNGGSDTTDAEENRTYTMDDGTVLLLPTSDDYIAIWNVHSNEISGWVPGWATLTPDNGDKAAYWTATPHHDPSYNDWHSYIRLPQGNNDVLPAVAGDGNGLYVALEVVSSGANAIYTAVARDGAFDGTESLTLTAILTDTAGNQSEAATTLTPQSIDTTAPDAPTLLAVADTDNSLFDQGFTVTEGSDVVVKVDGTSLTSAELTEKFLKTTADSVDTYTAKVGTFTGTESVSVDATLSDAAGNQSEAATTLTLQSIDTTAPIVPLMISYPFDGGTLLDTQLSVAAIRAITADIDGDGHLDIVTAAQISDAIVVFENDGNGNFDAGIQIVTDLDDNIYDIHAVDIDGDGHIDILGAAQKSGFSVFKNLGDGTFDTGTKLDWEFYNGARNIVSGDIDRDGDLDIIATATGSHSIVVFENVGSGTFGSGKPIETEFDTSVFRAILCDVDGDEDLDLISASAGDTDAFAVYKNDGEGNFDTGVQIETELDNNANWVHAADIDGDGVSDLVGSALFSNAFTVFTNDGEGNFDTGVQIETDRDHFASGATVGSLIGDHPNIVAWAAGNANSVLVFTTDGKGNIDTETSISSDVIDRPTYVTLADIDGDDDNDVLVSSYGNNSFVLFRNLGNAIKITGEAGADVKIYNGSDDITSQFSLTDHSGEYVAVSENSLEGIDLSLTTIFTDAAGNESAVSNVLSSLIL